jgi:hypothetical protein
MPLEFRYIPELHCIYTVGSGKLRLQDFLDYHQQINVTDPPPCLRVLSDYRALDASGLKTSDIEEIRASALAKTENKYTKVKEAIVASVGLTYGLSRVYDGVVPSDTYEMNVFADIHEAKRWLGLEADDIPQAV